MNRLLTWLKSPRHRPLLVYVAVALVILGPALWPGYILTLDMVFTPKLHLDLGLQSSLVFNATLTALNFLLPGWLIQKLLLLAIFTTAGLGMHRLAPGENTAARYAAALFYVINPFTYERLMAGQYLVLAGYALMPWFLIVLLRWLREPTLRRAVKVAALLVALSIVYVHGFGFALVIFLGATLVALIRARRPAVFRQFLKSSALIFAATLIASSYWLVPIIANRSPQGQLISGFDTRHFLSFRTEPDPQVGVPGTVLTLSGFWGERSHWFALPKGPYWPVTFAVLLALTLTGAVVSFRARPRLTAGIIALTLTAWVLAQGIMDSPFGPFNNWLFEHLALYRGYREPGKFIALVALGEAYFLAPGIASVLAAVHRRRQNLVPAAAALALALPWLYTPVMPLAAAGQLHATDYPADWYALGRALAAEPSRSKILVLPWHQYMYFDFAGRNIANPAAQFFGPRIIQGDNPEIGLITRQTTNSTSTFIEQQILDPDTGRTSLGARLRTQNIRQILLLKTVDYAGYAWLDPQPGLTLVQDSATYKLYRIE